MVYIYTVCVLVCCSAHGSGCVVDAGAIRQLFGYYYSIDTKACQSIHVQAKQVLLQKQVEKTYMHAYTAFKCTSMY